MVLVILSGIYNSYLVLVVDYAVIACVVGVLVCVYFIVLLLCGWGWRGWLFVLLYLFGGVFVGGGVITLVGIMCISSLCGRLYTFRMHEVGSIVGWILWVE